VATSYVCPACGYPTLGPALCAFCRPGEVFGGDQVFGPMSAVAPLGGGSVWVGSVDAGSDPAILAGPVAS
jgi:hypothetical protein